MMSDSAAAMLRSGQLAHAAGVNKQTLRYYERRGLLGAPSRTNGGHRLYPAEAVTILRVIKAAQRLGFSLAEVAELLRTGTRSRSGPVLADRIAERLTEVESAITELQAVADTLRATLDAGCDNLVECAGQPGCPLPFGALEPVP